MYLPSGKLTSMANLTYPLRHVVAATCFILTRILRSRILLVVGLSRSGTTLLGNILSLDASADYIHEPVKQLLQANWQQGKGKYSSDPLEFWSYASSSEISSFKLHALAVIVLYLLLKKRQYGSIYVIKLIAMMDSYELAAQMLKAPVIFISRHPCGRAESLVRQCELRQSPVPDLANFEKWGDFWGANNRRALSIFEYHPKWVWVKFEDLCNESIEVSKQLFNQLGLQWSTCVAGEIERMTNIESDEFYGMKRDARQQIDKWKARLSADQIEATRKGTLPYETKLYEGF